MFESWQLAMMDDAGYNGIRDEHTYCPVRSNHAWASVFYNAVVYFCSRKGASV